MYILLLLIGIIFGRNLDAIYSRTHEDFTKASHKFKASKTAFSLGYVVENIFGVIDRKLRKQELVQCSHDLISSCDKRGCRPIKIDTYWRKMKAAD